MAKFRKVGGKRRNRSMEALNAGEKVLTVLASTTGKFNVSLNWVENVTIRAKLLTRLPSMKTALAYARSIAPSHGVRVIGVHPQLAPGWYEVKVGR